MSSLARETALILRNDIRLGWRNFAGGRLSKVIGPLVLLVVMLLGCLVSVTIFLATKPSIPLAAETLVWALIAFFMFGACANETIAVFHERADFDLLFSSPVRPASVLCARLLSVTASGLVASLLIFLPLWSGVTFGLSRRYLAALPTWLSLGLIVAAIAIGLSLLAVRMLGARRARVWMQIVGAVLGASVYLVTQTGRLLPEGYSEMLVRGLSATLEAVGFPVCARAGRGNWLALAEVAVVAGVLVAGVLSLLDRVFLRSSQEAVATTRRKTVSAPHTFRSGVFAATLVKDLRLIGRDPLLISQLLPNFLYVIPAVLMVTRNSGTSALAPVALIFAVQGTASLATVASDGEECLDLILMSPTPEEKLRAAKAAAGAVIPCALGLAICVLVAVGGRPLIALLAAVLSLANAAAVGWLAVTRIRPAPRKDLVSWQNRRRGVGLARSLLILLLILSGSAAITLLQMPTPSALLFGFGSLFINVLTVVSCLALFSPEPFSSDPTINPA